MTPGPYLDRCKTILPLRWPGGTRKSGEGGEAETGVLGPGKVSFGALWSPRACVCAGDGVRPRSAIGDGEGTRHAQAARLVVLTSTSRQLFAVPVRWRSRLSNHW